MLKLLAFYIYQQEITGILTFMSRKNSILGLYEPEQGFRWAGQYMSVEVSSMRGNTTLLELSN